MPSIPIQARPTLVSWESESARHVSVFASLSSWAATHTWDTQPSTLCSGVWNSVDKVSRRVAKCRSCLYRCGGSERVAVCQAWVLGLRPMAATWKRRFQHAPQGDTSHRHGVWDSLKGLDYRLQGARERCGGA